MLILIPWIADEDYFPLCSSFFYPVDCVLVVNPCSYSLSYWNLTQSIIAPLMAWVAVLAYVWMRTHTENEKEKESFRSISQLNILGHKSSANIFGLLSQWIPELLGRPAFYWPSCERLVGKEWAHVGPWFLPTALQWWSNICCSFFWPCITRDQVVLLWRIQGKMRAESLAKGTG